MAATSPVAPHEFTAAMSELPAAVTVLTTWTPGGAPVGATLSAVTSLSLDPPLMLACLAHTSDTLAALRAGGLDGAFALNVLGDGQQDVARRFASKGPAKFDAVTWSAGAGEAPELAGSAVVVQCRLADLHEAGDHDIVIGAVARTRVHADATPLVYHRRAMAPTPIDGRTS